MTDLVGWMGELFTVHLGTIGTTGITLGLILAWALVVFLVIGVFRRIRGRG
jgi:hypothetical protein